MHSKKLYRAIAHYVASINHHDMGASSLTIESPGGGDAPKVFYFLSVALLRFKETHWLFLKYYFATFFSKKYVFGPPGGRGGAVSSLSNPNFNEI